MPHGVARGLGPGFVHIPKNPSRRKKQNGASFEQMQGSQEKLFGYITEITAILSMKYGLVRSKMLITEVFIVQKMVLMIKFISF